MQSESLIYLLYCKDRELGDRLERMLAGEPVQRVRSRRTLLAPPVNTCAIVFGTTTCTERESRRLRSVLGPLSPPCVVVAHLSVECLQQLYPLRSGKLQVVWVDEGRSRLIEALEEFRRVSRGPLWRLGLKLLSDYSLRPSVRETIGRVCGLHTDAIGTPFIPEHSVTELARHVGLTPSTLSRYWRTEVPLRCSLKEFLNWTVLLWTARERSRAGWDAISEEVGLRRRTLERSFVRLTGCRLAEAANDPERIVRRFNEWVQSVWAPHSVNGSRQDDPVSERAPGAQAT